MSDLQYKCSGCDELMEMTESEVSCKPCDTKMSIDEAKELFEEGKLVAVIEKECGEKDIPKKDKDDKDKDADDANDADKDKEVQEEGAEVPEYDFSVDVSEDVDALMKGEELSEDFGIKAKTIFEAAVTRKVKEQLSILEAKNDDKLKAMQEKHDLDMDKYLDYVVTEWMEENKLAIDSGIKAEMNESFLDGLKDLLENHYVDIPEDKLDMVDDLTSKIDSLQEELSEQVEKNVDLFSKIKLADKSSLVSEASNDMADTDKEKFLALTESISYEDKDSFKAELKTIKENYFSESTDDKKDDVIVEDIGGDLKSEKEVKEVDSLVSSVVNLLNANH